MIRDGSDGMKDDEIITVTKKEWDDVIRIMREDGIHIHKSYAAFQKSLEPKDPPKEGENPNEPPKEGDGNPPPKKEEENEPPKKRSLWWRESDFTE